MSTFTPLRKLPEKGEFTAGDTLVVFGEVFERGYVNGIIEEAKNAGLNIIYSTVGRRDENLKLRKLTTEEIADKKQTPLINIPLEAGFDLEPDADGIRPIDQLKDYGLTGWEDAKLDWSSIKESQNRGIKRFRSFVKEYMIELEKLISPDKNLIFVHTMAGGFPRAKVVMPIANRVFKGIGARFTSSQKFWDSEIGRLCDISFREVTGETFHHLIDLSSNLRNKIEKNGAKVTYVAYGYHGNEVLIEDNYEWYSYSPYLQGFAKCRLEEISAKAFKEGIQSTVFNVPEILTNSSSIFLGVEVVLYPLLRALKKEGPTSTRTKELFESCQKKLKNNYSLDDIDKKTQEYLTNPIVKKWPKFSGWPQHNGPEQMELMRNFSTALIEMHESQKNLITVDLSEVVFRACGKIMFNEAWSPHAPVIWVGHDAVAKATINNY
ncbi:MAG: hypothetical protein A2Z20_10630 [Bdellovibrionales bacterium RBG_16_40_8]|nr:MAG: hypothetical protein A2Z20_10630 [Bdellovibrionales bacterium RBG_16_40_8]